MRKRSRLATHWDLFGLVSAEFTFRWASGLRSESFCSRLFPLCFGFRLTVATESSSPTATDWFCGKRETRLACGVSLSFRQEFEYLLGLLTTGYIWVCECVCVYGKSKVSHGKLQRRVELCPLPDLVAELSSKFVPWVFRFATRAAFKCDLGRKCDYFIKRFGNVASVHKLQTHRREMTQSLSDDWALSNIIGFAYESRWKVVPVCHAAVDAAL